MGSLALALTTAACAAGEPAARDERPRCLSQGPGGTLVAIDPDDAVLAPSAFGNGPGAPVVAAKTGRAYLTRHSERGVVLSEIDFRIPEARADARDVLLDPSAARDPRRRLIVDGRGARIFVDDRVGSEAPGAGLLVYDMTAGRTTDRLVTPGVWNPSLDATAGERGRLYGSRLLQGQERAEVMSIDLADPALVPRFAAPTARPEGPPFAARQEPAPQARLVFFVAAHTVPARSHCNDARCQIWAFDPAAGAFRDDLMLEIPTGDQQPPGIRDAAVVHLPAPGGAGPSEETLVVVTAVIAYPSRTGAAAAGRLAPARIWAHGLGTFVTIAAMPPVSAARKLVLFPRGEVPDSMVLVDLGETGAPQTETIRLDGLSQRQFIHGVAIDSLERAYVAVAQFDGGRAGSLVVVHLSGERPPAERVLSQTPVAAFGLARPFAIDEARGVIYTNAIVDTGDRFGQPSRRLRLLAILRTPPDCR